MGVVFLSPGFTRWGGDGGREVTQSVGRALGLRCPKWLLGHPPSSPPPPADFGNNACGAGQSSGAPVSCVSRLAGVPRPRTPPEAALPPSDRPGSLTRTVLRTMVNKEQLFAAFDEWDSASYRPHSESFRRYSPHSGLGGVGQVAPATFAAGTLGRAFVPSSPPPPPPGSPCLSWCRWSQADGCSTGTNVC